MAAENKIVVDEELVQNYARIKNVSLEEARQRLEENLTKEAQVDIRQQMTTLMNAFRKMSPQLMGVVQREADYANGIKQLENKISGLVKMNEDLNKRLDFERDVYKKSMALLTDIVKTDEEVKRRLDILETPSLPLYKRIFNRIKCLLKP